MDFEGTFLHPGKAKGASPLRICGPGRIATTDQGVRISAFQPAARVTRFDLMTLVIAVAAGAGICLLFHLPTGAAIFGIAGGLVGAVMIVALLLEWGWHDPSRPVEFTIEWERLEHAGADDGKDRVTILARFPEGMKAVCFKPAMKPDSLLATLRRKGQPEA